MMKTLLPVALASALSCSSYALSSISYLNYTEGDTAIPMSIDESTLVQPGQMIDHKDMLGDTATIVIGDKTFEIRDIHKPCLTSGLFQVAVGWSMHLTLSGQVIGEICAQNFIQRDPSTFHSSFLVETSPEAGKHYRVTYENRGNASLEASSQVVENSVSYSW